MAAGALSHGGARQNPVSDRRRPWRGISPPSGSRRRPARRRHANAAMPFAQGVQVRPPTDAPPSTRPGNKARHTGRHHSVEPDVRCYIVPNLPHGVFRQGRNLKVLSDTVRFRRRGQDSGPALDGPGKRNLGRRFVDALGDSRDHRVVDNSRRHVMRQRCARLDHDPMLATEIEQIPLREIRMQFGLHQCRLDPRGRNDLLAACPK